MKKVIRLGEAAIRQLCDQAYCHPDWQQLVVRAHGYRLQAPIESLIAIEQVDRQQIQILPHQINAVMTVINKMRTRAILADEVGLGKTIEAGLVIKEYLARGLARRVLVLTPAPLTTQWRGELLYKFGEKFVVADRDDDSDFKGFGDHDRLIVSLDTAKQPGNAPLLAGREWDLIVVDEAHRLKNSATVAYKFVQSLNSRFFLMLTATPIQNSLFELYNLVHLLQEGVLGTPEHFKDAFVADRNGRVLRQPERLNAILQNVMVRNRRADVGLQFADRRVETVLLAGTPAEHALHEAVMDYVRGADGRDPAQGMKTLTYIRLSRMMASSPQVLAGTVRGMLASCADPVEATGLARILALAGEVETNSKTQALLTTLAETTDQAIVFTSFHETQRYLEAQLTAAGYSVICFSGTMSRREKDEAVERFRRGEGRIFLCTDAGSEGINLQFANVLVNYDLPWNPMRVEQRIGRVHRIGQQRDVVVVNMAIRDTIEEYILELLEQKIGLFTSAVGETDLILSNLRGSDSFEKAVIELVAQAKEPRQLRYQFEAFGETLAIAKQAADQIKSFDAQTLALLDLSAIESQVAAPEALAS